MLRGGGCKAVYLKDKGEYLLQERRWSPLPMDTHYPKLASCMGIGCPLKGEVMLEGGLDWWWGNKKGNNRNCYVASLFYESVNSEETETGANLRLLGQDYMVNALTLPNKNSLNVYEGAKNMRYYTVTEYKCEVAACVVVFHSVNESFGGSLPVPSDIYCSLVLRAMPGCECPWAAGIIYAL
ncbi:hypothetical protein EVAR_9849_1 [Eumeta japonica]|uniref:Uncharacterized protein n=1 Tax=Eumeta variegata TaxID=151549 RepID=A0A4C1TQA0_EUMVA|nr:hypothetical protein EVAR_9849_1 [Eumeta japonica]